MHILTIEDKREEKLLRTKVGKFDFSAYTKTEIAKLASSMRAQMTEAKGIGLAANQIGLNISVFVARVNNKFYAVFNPVIAEISKETEVMDEGCLSVPETYGATPRAAKVTLKGFDRSGRATTIKAWGLLARVFQHEVDHLNGVLFIDKAHDLRKYENERKYENK